MGLSELAEAIADCIAERLALRIRHDVAVKAAAGEYLDRNQVASMLGVSVVTVDRLTRTGKLPSIRLGTRVLYRKDAVRVAVEFKSSNDPGASTSEVPDRCE